MRVLYVFSTSVFSRRTRLALAHKGLDAEVRDARLVPEFHEEAKRLSPLNTMPVFVDEGRVLGDSTAIVHYLDLAYPDRPRLFPTASPAEAQKAVEIVAFVDQAMNALVDMGTRYWPLRDHPAYAEVVQERMRRAQASIDAVARLAEGTFFVGDAWSVADIWALSAAKWVASMPARAAEAPLVAQILTLGFVLPPHLLAWAKQHDGRPEVKAIYG